MSTIIIGGTISPEGTVISGKGFTVEKKSTGEYAISFNYNFSETPAIVGSQTGYGPKEVPFDVVCFPTLNKTGATAITGDNVGNSSDRQFSFIVMGE